MEKCFFASSFPGNEQMTITANAVMVNCHSGYITGKPFRTQGGIWRNWKVVKDL
jgi:hypothetical protein